MRKVILTPDLLRRVYDDHRFRAALDADVHRAWREEGSCVGASDPDLFFPSDSDHLDPARAICGRCPVAGPCLAEALGRAEIDGVWGGTTASERRSMRAVWRQHQSTAAAAS